jgi:N4-gp56 family major capsid protein
MAQTVIATGDALTVKKFSATLSYWIFQKSYWLSRFMGKAKGRGLDELPDKPIIEYTDLQKDAGDTIYFDLFKPPRGTPTEGDATLEGNEEKLILYTDSVKIDQMRHGVDAGGRMTRKRTVHDLRALARAGLSSWGAAILDEMFFVYASGDRGDGTTGWILPTSWTGRAGNSLQTPDSSHVVYGGDANSTATIDSSDVMSLTVLEKAKVLAETSDPPLVPINIDGEDHYVCVMHPYQAYKLRTTTSTGDWQDMMKNAYTRGKDNPLFKGALGVWNGIILHVHPKVITFTDWGSSSNLPGARALLLGKQALVIAYGSPGEGVRWDWHEELDDRGNRQIVDVGAIFGIKKTRFNNKDFGVIAIDTYAVNPNA